MVGRAQQLTPRRPHRPFKRFSKVRHLPPLHHLGRVFIEPQSLRYARQRHQQAPVAPPYPGAGTLFPWSVHRDSRTETLGEQTIRPKPGPSPCLRNRLRRSQGTAPSASAIGAETTARAPNHGACAIVRASSCLSATVSGRRGAPIRGLAQSAQRNVMFIEVAFRGAKNRAGWRYRILQ